MTILASHEVVAMETSCEEVEESHESSGNESVQGTSRKHSKKAPKRCRSMFIDDVAEEDDSDQEDDEEEEGLRRRPHKKSKPPVANYFDEEASVDNDEEETTDDENEIDRGFVVDELTDEEIEPNNGQRQRRPWFVPEDQEEDIEKMMQQFKDRHKLNQRGSDDKEEVDQQALLPSTGDPKLWLVKCMFGRERETSVCLMQKALDMPELRILSVTALDNLKGYLYIEAEKQAYVKEACKGMHNINNWAPMKMVPIHEMSSVMSVESKNVNFAKGSWVRMKRGIYKGDLGQVVSVDNIRNKVTVKLIPRINLRAIANKSSDVDMIKKQTIPPPQRLFKIQEARNYGIRIECRKNRDTGEYYDCMDNIQFKDGFLYKAASMKSITFQKIQPSIDEIEKFRESSNDIDADMASVFAKENKVKFVQGDAIIVAHGDLKNLMGWVEKVEEGFVHIRPERKDLPRSITVNEKYLCKNFKVGQHVKVVSGVQEGVTGMVLKVEGRVLVILSDKTKKDIRVFADYVVENYVISSGIIRSEDLKLQTTGQAPIGPQIKGQRQRVDPLIGRCIKIRMGIYKGYRGRVKEDKGSMVRVELESQMKIIYVKRDDVVELSNSENSFRGTPMRNGNQTPMHPSQTPLCPFYTPTRDPQATPIHGNMRTPVANRAWAPMSPSATPLHNMRTPMRDEEWSPWSPKGTPAHEGMKKSLCK